MRGDDVAQHQGEKSEGASTDAIKLRMFEQHLDQSKMNFGHLLTQSRAWWTQKCVHVRVCVCLCMHVHAWVCACVYHWTTTEDSS